MINVFSISFLMPGKESFWAGFEAPFVLFSYPDNVTVAKPMAVYQAGLLHSKLDLCGQKGFGKSLRYNDDSNLMQPPDTSRKSLPIV